MAQTRILYVEDYPVVQAMYVEVLKKSFDLDVVSDGKEALTNIKENHYDVILLDLLLPQMTGLEFLREYQKGDHKQDTQTRVVVLSDFDTPQMQKQVRDLGIKNYWIKVDHTPHALVDKLHELLSSGS